MTEASEPSYGLGTRALHAGQEPDPSTGARAVPIYQTTSYNFKDTQHAADLFALKEMGWIYTRLMNPTTDVLEQRMAALEGGIGALAVSSGMQAITVALLNICHAGGHIVASDALYGGTLTLLSQTFKRLNIETTFVDMNDPANITAAVKDNTRAVLYETVANPKNNVYDYQALADAAHLAGVPLICDNTTMTPILFRPFEHGTDIVCYSCTKFIGGHGTSIGGCIVDSGHFDWTAEPEKWPMFNEPDPAYHGAVFSEAIGQLCYIITCRTHWLRDFGGCISPFNAFLLLQGLETLHLRMPRHVENAQQVAEFLQAHSAVAEVNYPGLSSHRHHANAQKYLTQGCGAILGFNIKGGIEAGKQFIESCKLCSHLANIGDAKTLVIHPASTTHSQQSPEELVKAGCGPDYIRVSVGIEDAVDIIADLEQALAASQA